MGLNTGCCSYTHPVLLLFLFLLFRCFLHLLSVFTIYRLLSILLSAVYLLFVTYCSSR